MDNNFKIINGNMLEEIKNIEANSIDCIVTDPPYELGFMGKEWDSTGIAFDKNTWELCLNVLKPGGYLLAFAGSRTMYEIGYAIGKAGFEIRDTIMWLYGAGFPKSMNVGKQLEKRLEDERTKQETEHNLLSMWERDIQKTKSNEKTNEVVLQSQLQEQSLQRTMYGKESIESTQNGKESSMERWNNIQKTKRELQRCKVCEMSKRVSINGEERWICNGTQACDGKTLRQMFEQSGSCPSYRPQSEQQQDRELNAIQEQCRTQENREVIEYWNKFGTALKPSFEPIIVARKPFSGSLVDNIIDYGVGGINIDECRIGNEKRTIPIDSSDTKKDDSIFTELHKNIQRERVSTTQGRFPANTILTYDETDFDEVCGGFPQSKGSSSQNVFTTTSKYGGNSLLKSSTPRFSYQEGYNDNGSASRYFYCAKASVKDRDEGLEELDSKPMYQADNEHGNLGAMYIKKAGDVIGDVQLRKNIHPTVKPTELMQYLVRLVAPKGATILDPFMGSGSTGKAVAYENNERETNYKFIGIEQESEYCKIAEIRINYALGNITTKKVNEITGETEYITIKKPKQQNLF